MTWRSSLTAASKSADGLDVAHDRQIARRAEAAQERAQLVVGGVGLVLGPLGQHAVRGVLGLLNVGLVERVDAQHPADGGDGELGEEEDPSEVVRALDLAHDDRVSGLAQRRDLGVGRLIGRLGVAQVQEGAVRAVDVGGAQRLVDHRQDPLAVLAGRLGDELLDPEPEGLQRRIDDVGQLVAAGLGQLAPGDAEPQPARHVTGLEALAVVLGDAGGVQDAGHVGAHERRGHEAEERQRAVAPADVGVVEEGAPEAVLARELLEARSPDR
jgi:hypothetical protein